MRQIDRLTVESFKTPSLLLMEAAANACLNAISSHFGSALGGKKALVLCGKGNNGGDGAALARSLTRYDVHCDVVLIGRFNETIGDARINFEAVKQLASFEAGSPTFPSPLTFTECDEVSEWEQIARPRRSYDIIVDALFGTGLTRPLEGLFLKIIEHLDLLRKARERASGIRPLILSIDLPSGLNADKANPIGPAVQADMTVTLTAPKPANVLAPASDFCGELTIANIGSPLSLVQASGPWLYLTEAKDVTEWLSQTRYTSESYKNTHGLVLVIAGSRNYSGAAVLCGDAAMKSGAGLVTIATPSSIQNTVASRSMPEVITTPLSETEHGSVSDTAVDEALKLAARSTVVAIGPGLSSDNERTRSFVRALVEQRTCATVVDADALNCLSPWPNELLGSKELPLILTPHPGEMLRLIGADHKTALEGRVVAAREFASAHKLILVLKGSRSVIATPDGQVIVNPTGNPGLGTGGSGDTLTGLIAGFLAQSLGKLRANADPIAATVAALYIGGVAGDIAARELGMRVMVASDIRERLSAAIRSLDPHGEDPGI